MQLCIPIQEDKGLQSPISQHFGSAPSFLLVDTESMDYRAIDNQTAHHAHGMCKPVAAIQGHNVDAVVVGGIGMGALMKLRAAGIQVYHAYGNTVLDTITALKSGTLAETTPDKACTHHGHH